MRGTSGEISNFGNEQQTDYWGVNTFRLNKLEQLLNALRGDSQNSPVWPDGFYALIKEHAELFPDKEIMIIENGCVPEAHGMSRHEYLHRHIEQVQRACKEGANIVAYVCWSITTNREWGLKLSAKSDFGLYKIDLDNDSTLARVATDDVAAYSLIIQRRAALNLASTDINRLPHGQAPPPADCKPPESPPTADG